ncbi:hypothetical protein EUGRSUZ_G00203 [Eucalyptus grandis]|uniref:Uncharacterized protein n=2 Tax=Eucalyptus grandis TaxID=71139 RepID=A0ACC3K109_EUCGR|nr:hypothetical protein EUGRSUZ_G00203 [Eucalyptus grandis]
MALIFHKKHASFIKYLQNYHPNSNTLQCNFEAKLPFFAITLNKYMMKSHHLEWNGLNSFTKCSNDSNNFVERPHVRGDTSEERGGDAWLAAYTCALLSIQVWWGPGVEAEKAVISANVDRRALPSRGNSGSGSGRWTDVEFRLLWLLMRAG